MLLLFFSFYFFFFLTQSYRVKKTNSSVHSRFHVINIYDTFIWLWISWYHVCSYFAFGFTVISAAYFKCIKSTFDNTIQSIEIDFPLLNLCTSEPNERTSHYANCPYRHNNWELQTCCLRSTSDLRSFNSSETIKGEFLIDFHRCGTTKNRLYVPET